jgi:hypothetical protein
MEHTIILNDDELSMVRTGLILAKTEEEWTAKPGEKMGLRLKGLCELLRRLPRPH